MRVQNPIKSLQNIGDSWFDWIHWHYTKYRYIRKRSFSQIKTIFMLNFTPIINDLTYIFVVYFSE